jgi:hypothetical protein
VVFNFEGLLADSPFIGKMHELLKVLREKIGLPVDIEFAHDREHLYLLQCRTQSRSREYAPTPIPRHLAHDKTIFRARRQISNGRVPDITHIVYVDGEAYANLGSLQDLRDVGRVIGKINVLLPKRQFILMGPGRWGSRGDIKLGVNVTYSDINHTAVLMEIARQKGHYLPELSFGTHFFQDLVEAEIRYIPLYADEKGAILNERFLLRSRNILPDLLPDFGHLAEVVRVIDVPGEADGQILRVMLNADLDEAVGILAPRGTDAGRVDQVSEADVADREDHWSWRLQAARSIAARLDGERFGVKALYVFGSTKNATAGPASDIDLLMHVSGDESRRRELQTWLEGWSSSLAEYNYLRTGYRLDGILDVHFVTDADIARRTSYAAKIDAVTDAARPLALGGFEDESGN